MLLYRFLVFIGDLISKIIYYDLINNKQYYNKAKKHFEEINNSAAGRLDI